MFPNDASVLINTQATIAELLKQVDHYSHLHGVAQMQLGAPTISLPDTESTAPSTFPPWCGTSPTRV